MLNLGGVAVGVQSLGVEWTTQQLAATSQDVGPVVLMAVFVVPVVIGIFALSAALAWRKVAPNRAVVDLAIGVVGVGIAFQIGLVGFLLYTGRYTDFLRWPIIGDASLYLSILVGLGLSFLVIWLGVLHGLVKQADAHADQVDAFNRKLRHRTEELEEFSYAVSHDLKSPLISLQWLLSELNDETEPQERERLTDRIGSNVDQMTSLVEDLLLLAKIEREGTVDTTEPLFPVALEAKDALAPLWRRRGVAVSVEGSAGVLVQVPKVRLRQVLQNLLLNAIIHGQEQGHVRVSCKDAPEDARIRLEVADDGPGVPEAEREAIFNAFMRGSRSNAAEGSGIGLALVRKIARAYGGRAWVEDAPEGGACFCVLLPGEFAQAEPNVPVNMEETIHSSSPGLRG